VFLAQWPDDEVALQVYYSARASFDKCSSRASPRIKDVGQQPEKAGSVGRVLQPVALTILSRRSSPCICVSAPPSRARPVSFATCSHLGRGHRRPTTENSSHFIDRGAPLIFRRLTQSCRWHGCGLAGL